MRKKLVVKGLLGLLILGAWLFPAHAGDSLFGTVTEVRSGEFVVLDYGKGQYIIRIVGIDVPREGEVADQAKAFVAGLVLNKRARVRTERVGDDNQMLGILLTADKSAPIRDVGLELVRSGLARRQSNYDYKYGELSAAESEARRAKRGLWSSDRQR
jgi:endonuclease YncB( thermonuclease family)